VSTSTVVIIIVAFLALDLVCYYLIIRAMDRPSPSAAFARARGFSLIPDSEQEAVGIRLRERLPVARGDLYDIVRLPLAAGEGYLFSTLPEADSHLPRTRENQRQFIAVLIETALSGGVLIHPPIRPPLAGFKGRRLFRVFKAGTFVPISADRLPEALAERYRVRIENERVDQARLFTSETIHALTGGGRRRGFALLVCYGGFVVYINPSLKGEVEVGEFYDLTRGLVGALSKAAR
jgi:hypothetical protein